MPLASPAMANPRSGPARVNTGLLVAGWALAVVFPIVGLILGVIVLSNGATTHGWGIITLAVIMAAIWLVAL